MDTLIISVSGVRGIVGESFHPSLLTRFAIALGTFAKSGKVVLGRDSRTSGEMARHALLSGLIATGCEVVDVGICPTPTILLRAKNLQADGSITITASHNPIEWNGIEFAVSCGSLLNPEQSAELMRIYESGEDKLMPQDKLGSVKQDDTAVERHIAKILSLPYIDVRLIKSRRLKVVIDCCNGAGSVISPKLLRQLGCEVIELGCHPNGKFPRHPEPAPEHLSQLCELVRMRDADIGFAHDSDADRLAIVSDKAEAISNEYTFVLASDFILSKQKGPVVATSSTSMMMDYIARKWDVPLYRTKVGVGNVVGKMQKVNAVVGGEGTGGVIFPEIHHTTDGITTLAVIIQQLAECGATISELVSEIPKYSIIKKKIEISNQQLADDLMQKAAQYFADENPDLTDGVKIIGKDSWVNIRKSGTEPVIRVFSEARTTEEAGKLCDSTIKIIQSWMG
ncbi:TPA: phosphoglucosamine mutase [Candidatus Poribacteria bacterium]|nr:phosphoglucosamine mutase [Candidatus Poribacteria bacterium]